MKKILYLLAGLLTAVSCTNETPEAPASGNEAELRLAVAAENESPVYIRATDNPVADDLYVTVKNSGTGEVVVAPMTYGALRQQGSLYLPGGADADHAVVYQVEAYSLSLAEAAVAQKGKPCFYAATEVKLVSGEITTAALTARLQQVQFSFEPSTAFQSAFRSEGFKLSVSTPNGHTVEYTSVAELSQSAYFPGGTAYDYVTLALQATTVEGFPVNFSQMIRRKADEQGAVPAMQAPLHLVVKLEVSTAGSATALLDE